MYRTLLIWPFAVSPPIAGILFDRLLASNGLIAGWWSDITGNDFPNYKTSVIFARVERLSWPATLLVVAANLGLGVVLVGLKVLVSH